jgi:hypothetical protein
MQGAIPAEHAAILTNGQRSSKTAIPACQHQNAGSPVRLNADFVTGLIRRAGQNADTPESSCSIASPRSPVFERSETTALSLRHSPLPFSPGIPLTAPRR